ncbi:MAG: sigma-70 family RNA polymerase sigma factor [Planctomycetota bacterium]
MPAAAESSPSEKPIAAFIDSARGGNTRTLGQLLQLYRNYLSVLATTQLDRRLWRRFSTSDLVQETMLAAHRDFGQFRGNSEGELLAWLRQILVNCLSHEVEKNIHAQKRDMRREVDMDQIAKKIDDSMARMSNLIADDAASPSRIVGQRELADELANQLNRLKPSYREVIVLRNLQGESFQEIADRMGIKSGAARMLWTRAIAQFKEVCDLSVSGGG